MRSIFVFLLILGLFKYALGEEGFCSAPSVVSLESKSKPLYWKVDNPTLSPLHLQDLPGFTRSVYKRDHALISPESHVYSPLPDWINTSGAYLISPEMGSHFVMYLAKLKENSRSGLPLHDVERFFFVLQGAVTLTNAPGVSHLLKVDSYAYLPPNFEHSIECDAPATIVVFERRYAPLQNHVPELVVSSTDEQPLLETPGEMSLSDFSGCNTPNSSDHFFKLSIFNDWHKSPYDWSIFELRKLLPTSLAYDFNIHIMDFQPGEFLNVKEVHYNQHGLLLLEGQGIYRLGDIWYPVQAGDVIWMAPFVTQWYAALGKTPTRYLLYKDVNRSPL